MTGSDTDFLNQDAVAHLIYNIGVIQKIKVMGAYEHSSAFMAYMPEHLHDKLGIFKVQAAGRLISNYYFWRCYKGADY